MPTFTPPPPAGQIRRHHTGAVAVACAQRDGTPPSTLVPCWAVVSGHAWVGGHMWLTCAEVTEATGWRIAGHLDGLLAATVGRVA